jgi:hypothetical protein
MKSQVPSNYYRDHTGKRYGMMTVIGFDHYEKRSSYWLCRCDCGNEKIANMHSLVTGGAKSCGCLRIAKVKEAKAAFLEKVKQRLPIEKNELKSISRFIERDALDKKLSNLLSGIKQRCYNKNNDSYVWYGARGIDVCEEWLADKWSFVRWAKQNGYKPGLLIDRERVNEGYYPDNCRFVTPLESSRNTRKNIKATINGEEKLFIEWCEQIGLRYNAVYQRYIKNKGFTPEAAIMMALIIPHEIFFESKVVFKSAVSSVMKHKDVLFKEVWESLHAPSANLDNLPPISKIQIENFPLENHQY